MVFSFGFGVGGEGGGAGACCLAIAALPFRFAIIMSDKSGRVINQRGIVRFTVPKVPGRVVEERPRYNVVTALLRDRFGTLKVKNISRNNILQNYCNISHCESQQ